MKTVFCDESGATGQNLSDLAQPVFTLASTIITSDTANHLLSRFERLAQKEVKYSKVKRTLMGQRLLLEFLNEPALHGGAAKVYAIHKPFMIVSKLVDMIHEPLLHEMGENFYQQKAALATANVLAITYPVFIGVTRFDRLLSLFVEAVRTKEKQRIQRFFAEAHKVYDFISRRQGTASAEILLPIFVEERSGANNIIHASVDALDPVVPNFMVHAHHWSIALSEMFEVVADDSSVLERWEDVCLEFSDPAGGHVSAEYYGQRIEYPLKVQSFRFVDSASEPSVRITDLIAGAVADSLTPLACKTGQSQYQQAIFKAIMDKDILLGGIWPSAEVTPEALDAGSKTDVHPAQIGAEFLQRVHEAKRKSG